MFQTVFISCLWKYSPFFIQAGASWGAVWGEADFRCNLYYMNRVRQYSNT